MNAPRSAAALGKEFPYTLSTLCYMEVTENGTVTWGTDAGTVERVRSGRCRLYAVWPGEWSSHMFAIDDIDEFARAKGFVHDEERTGLADHEHRIRWEPDPYGGNPTGAYVYIGVWLDCGCEIRSIKTFAKQMREQRGWDIATSTGWGTSGAPDGPHRYSLRVRRKSLD
jgi:hypothetical protein